MWTSHQDLLTFPQHGANASDRVLAPLVAKHLEINLKEEWDSANLATVLATLMDHLISMDILMEYRLGRLIKLIRKRAIANEDRPIMELSTKVMEKWRMAFHDGYPCTTKKKPPTSTTLRLTTEKVNTSSSSSKPVGNKTCFYLSNNPSFFSRTTSSRSSFTPRYPHQQIDMHTLLDQLEQKNTLPVKSKSFTPSTESKTTRRARFKVNPQEVAVGKHSIDTSRVRNTRPSLANGKHQHASPKSSWYPPHRIHIPDSCKRPCPKKEKPLHDSHLPTSLPSPREPDEPLFMLNNYTKIIPLFEIDTACGNHQQNSQL